MLGIKLRLLQDHIPGYQKLRCCLFFQVSGLILSTEFDEKLCTDTSFYLQVVSQSSARRM